ncbi:MAG: hypothetical protein HQM03_17705 [Magnetococcales bacterium]|nr:hypothetical protein [Magnetococcales bacterium]
MKKIVAMLAVCLSVADPWPVHAEDLSVPHTFAAGTPIKSAEVNENFAQAYQAINKAPSNDWRVIVIRNDGKTIGKFISEWGFITKKGYFASLEYDFTRGDKVGIPPTGFFYTTSDCTGHPYVIHGVPGTIKHMADKYYYFPVDRTPEFISYLTYGDAHSCQSMVGSRYMMRILPNDPEITGFPDALTDVTFAIE